MVNDLSDGVNNPFALLDVFDFLDCCAEGWKKDEVYVASLSLTLIDNLVNMKDVHVSL